MYIARYAWQKPTFIFGVNSRIKKKIWNFDHKPNKSNRVEIMIDLHYNPVSP